MNAHTAIVGSREEELTAEVDATDALRRQMRRGDLRELLDAHVEERGVFSAEEIAEAREALYGQGRVRVVKL